MSVRSVAVLLGIAVALGGAVCATANGQNASAPSKGEKPADPAKTTESTPPTDSQTTSSTANAKTKPKLEKATFGSGCFWCGEAVFERIPGVKSVVSGYSGGTVPNPTYEEVSSGLTGHAEVFQVEYDPAVAPYEKLLKYFWASHDPTTPNQQGPDFGTQYRSVIFYHNDAQRAAAMKSMQDLASKGAFLDAISTQVMPMTVFYPAEPYHQDYFRKHKGEAYCQMFIVPKLKKLQHLNIK